MRVILELAPEVESRLRRKAEREGQDVGSYLLTVAEREGATEDKAEAVRLQTQLEKNQAALAVLKEWDEEDATDDPEEIARRQAELDEFKAALNESHTSNRVIYP